MSGRPQLVVGLGNPGREYQGTRHNAGFAVLDMVAERWECRWRRRWRFSADVGEAVRGAMGKVVLAKPRTYMNRSGMAVAALARWLKTAPSEILVIVDDVDLPLGRLRLLSRGGSGGHNGLRSVIEALGGSEQFARLRVGIGRRDAVGEDVTGHVLGRFRAEEQAEWNATLARATEAVECAVERGLEPAMNEFNRRPDGAERGQKGESE